MTLSKLVPHPCADVTLEQYATEGDLAAYWMLAVDQLDGLEGRVVADLGAGNGILGIAALMLGASRVLFVEADPAAVAVLEENLAGLDDSLAARASVIAARVGRDDVALDETDLIIMNPPWGVQQGKRTDRFWNLPSTRRLRQSMYSTATTPSTWSRWPRRQAGRAKSCCEQRFDFRPPTLITLNEKGPRT